MILKSIDIKGFKSFADSTELIFNRGITSVIGPNGSGKSNISDAIRWCLGEQSVKSLRGGKMEDVIFGGTEYRNPLSLAQVSLTIDNSTKELPIDYNTVTISRKLYRSGESEYLINNKPCKLKDITQLFFDTGIGKEGYSLIGQGKIDGILNSNADDRRTIIEEAIGITKYKFKKEEAQNKINHANENLIRVNDMLNTYMEYLEPLHIESDKAKKFIELSNELKDIEILLFYNNLYEIYGDIDGINREIFRHNLDIRTFISKKLSLEEQRKTFELRLEELKTMEDQGKNKYYKIKDLIQRHIDIINLRQNEVNILGNSNNIYNKQISENNIKIQNIGLRENIINKTKSELEHEFDNITLELNIKDNLKAERDAILSSLENDYKALSEEKNDLINKNSNINNKLEIIESSFARIDNEKRAYMSEKSSIEDKIFKFEEEIKGKNLIGEKLSRNRKSLEESIEGIFNSINSKDNEINELKTQIDILNRNLLIKQTNVNALVEFENKYEGFSKASKVLMKEIKGGELSRFKDMCFIIGNVINVKEEYALAIETAIGAHISDIIIEDCNFAKDLIDYLKNNKLGRITFQPLNSINKFNFKFLEGMNNRTGFVDFAINLVNVDKKFEKIISNILGNTIICDNIDNALVLAKGINFSNRIVTLDSQVINSGGSITGGSSYSKKFNVLGRQSKISRELDEIKVKEKNLRDLEHILEGKRIEINILKEEMDKLNSSLREINSKILYNSDDIKQINDLIQQEQLHLIKNNTILESLTKTTDMNESERIKLKEELNENIRRGEELENKFNLINTKLDAHRRLIEDEENNIINIKIKKAKLEENISNIYEESKRIALEKEEILHISNNINENIKSNNSRINKLNIKIDNLKLRLDKLNGVVTNYNFNSYVSEQNTISDQIKVIATEIGDVEVNIHKLEQEVNNLKIKNSKKEVEFNIISNNLLDKYNKVFDIKDRDLYVVDEEKIKECTEKAKNITNNINDLGSINLKAIEEYENLNNKVNFIVKQREDLEKSKNELENFINDVTLEMREIFKENFKHIDHNFNLTFRELFKGGTARLILGEGDELESKIDIIVQPPGKKLQNINLLSGGEKGLSAIALLFAILKLKPVPFCVLDEIEAALDDNNVIKFANFLKQYSHNVQFIVITHRKPTMESSDIIYGVTMQEKGVSKVVSINLANYNV